LEDGRFIKIEVATNRVVTRGSLLEVKEARALFPESFRETGIGVHCYDRNTGRLYVTAPQNAFLSWDKHGRGTVRYRVVIFELPTFRLMGNIELTEPVYIGPNILLTPDGDRLLVSYEVVSDDDKHWVFVKEEFNTKSLERIESKREAVSRTPYNPIAVAKARFSDKAYFAPDGETIYDEEYAIKGELVTLRPKRQLPAKVEQFVKEHPNFFRHGPMWLDESGRRILLWEMDYRERVRKHFDGSTGKTTEEKYTIEYATGRFAIYDALAEKRLREWRVQELEGDTPKLISIAPDGRLMYFSKWVDEQYGELYAVDLTKEAPPVRLPLFGLDAYHVQCFFADR
jgi:hypothetical protein